MTRHYDEAEADDYARRRAEQAEAAAEQRYSPQAELDAADREAGQR